MTKGDFILGVLSSLLASILYSLGLKTYERLHGKLLLKRFYQNSRSVVSYFNFSFHNRSTARTVLSIALFSIALITLVNPVNKVLAPTEEMMELQSLKICLDLSTPTIWKSGITGKTYIIFKGANNTLYSRPVE